VLQRAIKGQAGAQRFFHDAGRAFCLYVVLGAFANRRTLVPAVNQVLATLTVGPLDASGAPATTTPTTVAPESTTTAPPTTEAPSTTAPPPTTATTTSGP
jgi:hypothetical protein